MAGQKSAEKVQKISRKSAEKWRHAFLENVTHFSKNLTQRYFSPVARYSKEVVVKKSDMMYQKYHERGASKFENHEFCVTPFE